MSKYRFKTAQEFIRDGLWNHCDDVPCGWNSEGEMNKYLGMDVPEEFNSKCDGKQGINFDDWFFNPCDYVLKDEASLVGRYIKALIDYPNAVGVKKGEYIKIVSKRSIDPCYSLEMGYVINLNIDTYCWEVMPDGFVPPKKYSFIRGNWYYYNNHYVKYSHHNGDIWVASEYIFDEEHYYDHGFTCGSDDEQKKEVSLSQVQPFLPDGHPDKIEIEASYKFEKGKWYKWYQKNHKNYYYGKFNHIDGDYFKVSPWICNRNTYEEYGTFFLNEAEQIEEISFDVVKEFLPPFKEKKSIEFDKLGLYDWLREVEKLNLSLEELEDYIGNKSNYSNVYIRLEGKRSKEKAKILYDKWNKDGVDPAYYEQVGVYDALTPSFETKPEFDLYGPTPEIEI